MRAPFSTVFSAAFVIIVLGGCGSAESRPASPPPAPPPAEDAPETPTGSIVIKGSKTDDGASATPATDQAKIDALNEKARESQGKHESGDPLRAPPVKAGRAPPPSKEPKDDTITVFMSPAMNSFTSIHPEMPRTVIGEQVTKGARWIHIRMVSDEGWIHATKPKGSRLADRGDAALGVTIYDSVSGQAYATIETRHVCDIVERKNVNGAWWYHVRIGATDGWTTLVNP